MNDSFLYNERVSKEMVNEYFKKINGNLLLLAPSNLSWMEGKRSENLENVITIECNKSDDEDNDKDDDDSDDDDDNYNDNDADDGGDGDDSEEDDGEGEDAY